MQSKNQVTRSNVNSQDVSHFNLYECQVFRKHFFKNSHYFLKLTTKTLILSLHSNHSRPKYVYTLNLDQTFHWIINENSIIGFQLPYKNIMKDFYGSPIDMINFKQKLGCYVSFEKINIFYKKEEIISSGAFGRVSKYICKFTKQVVAVKSMKIKDNTIQAIKNEIEILRKLKQYGALNILEIKEVFKDEMTYYIITEYIDCENLKQQIDNKKKPYSIQETLRIAESLLKALLGIHQLGIIHRDLKPANLMLDNETIKIIDFGLACLNGKQMEQYPSCGTTGYSAPEVLNILNKKHSYDEKVDLFSVGCILYKLLTLQNLFQSETERETYQNNKQCNFNIQEKGQIFELTKLLLKYDPQERIDCQQAIFLIQSLIENKHFDINLWYQQTYRSHLKGKILENISSERQIQSKSRNHSFSIDNQQEKPCLKIKQMK